MPGFQLPRCSVLEIVSETQKKDPMQQLLNYTTTRLGGLKQCASCTTAVIRVSQIPRRGHT